MSLIRKVITWLLLSVLCQCGVAATVTISVPESATSPEQFAACELREGLRCLFPENTFEVGNPARADATVLVGTTQTLAPALRQLGIQPPTRPEGFRVAVSAGDPGKAVIVGGSPRGTVYGVYRLLEKLGYGFFLSFDTAPEPRKGPFRFEGWDLADHPLADTRLVFNWHNFLSGCTGWDLPQWQRWVSGSQKMGFNTVMVHAYGNNPMFTFSFNGKSKPVGWVATTRRGRDWGNEHINDVRRMPGGEIFDTAEFGCKAALVPDDQRVAAKQALMKQVFTFAESRGMDVCFALDVDTGSMLPPDMIASLPESARFRNGSTWLPRPDTDEGYSFYKTQVDALFALYPQIDFLALWRRGHGQEWGKLKKASQLPKAWQAEYEARVGDNPAAAELPQAVCSFALSKVVGAFRRALDERGRKDVRIGMGSWGVGWIPALMEFLPEEVTIMPLDASYLRTRRGSFFEHPDAYKGLSTGRGRLLPIIWAHHDDGDYIGRPIHPHANFHGKLEKLEARGYGIIHWMTRPLDVYFKNHENQVWGSTRNEPYEETCRKMARHCFGPASADSLGEYLYDWWTDAPIFGRVTTDHFFRQNEHISDPEIAVEKCRERIALLQQVDVSKMTPKQRGRVAYFRALENLLISFCEVQEFAYRPAVEAIKGGKYEKARHLLRSADPADTIRRFSRLSQMTGADRGEETMVISLGTRWITDYIAARQAAGLEAIRIDYGPTAFEPLAQGAGSYTFHVDAKGNYGSVRGERETKRTVTDEGVSIDAPTALTLSPIVKTQSQLAAGEYELALTFAGTDRDCVIDVSVLDESATGGAYTFAPTSGRFLRLVCRGSNENAWNSIHEIRCDALLREGVTASAAVSNYESAKAVDGKAETRWAAEGRGQWIQFTLKEGVRFNQVNISWYEGSSRTYDFDLMVSDNGADWRSVILQSSARPAGRTRRIRVSNSDTPLELPVKLARPGTVQVKLTPVSGNACVRGAVLTRVEGRQTEVLSAEVIRQLMRRVNAHQLAHPWKEIDRNWIRATYYTGVMAAYRATGEKAYLEQAMRWADKHDWQVGNERSGANVLTCCQTYLQLHEEKQDAAMVRPLVEWLASGKPNTPTGAKVWYLEGGRRYADSLYVGPPTLAMLAKATGEPKYLDWMHAFSWDVHRELFDKEENLFYRDKRFIAKEGDEPVSQADTEGKRTSWVHTLTRHRKKVLWSRGNGWVFAGIARILQYLPGDDPQRPRHEALFKNMATSLLERQMGDGLWPVNLADRWEYTMPETSGTGFFCYGLAWGVNAGLLDGDVYEEPIYRAWKGLTGCLSADGKVQWGQPVAAGPYEVRKGDSHEYVTGTFLLAGSEVLKMVGAPK